jgi:curved DNA-binding protein CbpA
MVWRDVDCKDNEGSESQTLCWIERLPLSDPYQTLGVSRSASLASVKHSFRKLAKECHPDTQQGELIGFAKIRMQQINEAYAILRCAEKRAAYDKSSSQGHPLQAC